MDFHELEEIRLDAYESLRIYKERTKAFHDKRIVPKVFKAGDDVLLYNSRLKLFPGKLKSRWSGPFKVKEVLPYGDITLVNQNGVEFMVTVTGTMAKTKFTKRPAQNEDVETARKEKREGKKKVEYSGKRKKGASKESLRNGQRLLSRTWTTR
ncbi:unnamed protein product [Microthlaspi erraticum]|uniref:Reverse transcriptase domain-containing protein n=1 Tax=Microthlaspi erraticum TaxID=1685480 RepID=A0A6D2I6I7_9BRAS|nr:unnamed protein product [Microthlaspi erraticum]